MAGPVGIEAAYFPRSGREVGFSYITDRLWIAAGQFPETPFNGPYETKPLGLAPDIGNEDGGRSLLLPNLDPDDHVDTDLNRPNFERRRRDTCCWCWRSRLLVHRETLPWDHLLD